MDNSANRLIHIGCSLFPAGCRCNFMFPVVRILNSETTSSVLNALKGIYCNFGLPRKLLSDNGPCFKSADFKEFHAKLGMMTETCSAYNHASVGSVE